MKKIVFITGGARSGKSAFAVARAKKSKGGVIFLATGKPADSEMRARVRKHKRSRPRAWRTVEEDINIAAVISKLEKEQVVIIDCLTLWLSNLLLSGRGEEEILKKVKEFIAALKNTASSVIIVSNEVGGGVVPENKLARAFRDIVGIAHQRIVKVSDEAYFVVCGIPLPLKA